MSSEEYSTSSDEIRQNLQLFLAIRKRSSKKVVTVEKLLKKGADINAQDANNKNNTILHRAVRKRYKDVVEILVKHGAKIDLRNADNQTAIDLAVKKNDFEILNILRPQSLLPGTSGLQNQSRPAATMFPSSQSSSPVLPKIPYSKRNIGDVDDSPKKFRNTDTQNGSRKRAYSSTDEDDDPTYVPSSNTYSSKDGLKLTFHGNMYQLKLLIVFVLRGVSKKYLFRLATEMSAAEKFDDLVFEYIKKDPNGKPVKNSDGNCKKVYRFLQAKHKLDEEEKITYGDLVTTNTDGEFCLSKYFLSYQKIKKNPMFLNSEFQDFIICTNISFDVGSLQSNSIKLIECTGSDDILNDRNNQRAKRFKFGVGKTHKFYELLSGCEMNQLAKVLVNCINKGQNVTLQNETIKSYHVALVCEDVVVSSGVKGKFKFSTNFLKYNLVNSNDPNNPNLSKRAITFKGFLRSNGLSLDNSVEFQCSEGFGKRYEYNPNPQIDVKEFITELVTIIKNFKPNEAIVIKRQKQIIKNNIDILSGHVLIEKDQEIRFSSEFLSNNQLPGNLDDFRKNLLTELGTQFNLKQMHFKINDFRTCEDGKKSVSPTLPEVYAESEVSKFFDNLIFAVSQPNEKALSEIIRDEIGQPLNLKDTDLFASSFENAMQDWFKERGKVGEEGTFFLYKDGTLLFEKIKQKFSIIKLVHSKVEYYQEILELEIEYDDVKFCKKLKEMLDSSDNICNVTSEYLKLTACKIFQTLLPIETYGKKDSFIYVHLTTVVRIREEINKAFQLNTIKLLIIECDEHNFSEEMIRRTYEMLLRIFKSKFKLILVSKKGDSLLKYFDNKMKAFNDHRTDFNNLNLTSQNKLFGKCTITLQQADLRLGEIIHRDSKNIIDSEAVAKLVNNEKISIGQDLKSLGDIENYYIDRFFQYPNVEIRSAITKVNIPNNIIVVSDEESDYIRACHENPDKNVHWLQKRLMTLQWQKTYGSVTALIDYREAPKFVSNVCIKEDELFMEDRKEKVVIISDVAGMGKSTVLTYLSKKLKQDFPHFMIIRIDLMKYNKIFLHERKRRKENKPSFRRDDTENAIQFLELLLDSDKSTERKSTFEKAFYRNSFLGSNISKTVLVFDGFDEICPNYKDIMLDLLQNLTKTKVERIFITTRPHTKEALERELGVFAFTLRQFTNDEEVHFLKKFWKRSHQTVDEARLHNYANALIKHLSTSITDREKQFTGIPLQLRMVAEVFQESGHAEDWEGCNEFLLRDHKDPKLPQKLDLVDLYTRFVEKKFYVYEHKNEARPVGDISDENRTEYYVKGAKVYHKKLAVQMLFAGEPPSLYEESDIFNDIEKEVLTIGIVTRNVYGEHDFIHRTFAEYFAAEFFENVLANKVRLEQNEQLEMFLLTDILVKPNYQIVRSFLDSRLGRFVIPNCTLESYGKLLNQLWSIEDMQNFIQDDRNTVLHIATKEKNSNIIRFLIESLQDYEDTRVRLINANNETTAFPTMLFMIVENGDVEMIKYIVRNGSNLDFVNKSGFTSLYQAIKYGYQPNTIKTLIDLGAYIDNLDEDGKPIVCEAAEQGNLEVLDYLIKKDEKIDKTCDAKISVLHYATYSGKIEVVRHLIKQGADVNATDESGNTVLHYAAHAGNFEICELLIQSNADSKAVAEDGSTVLHEVAISGNLKLFKYLASTGISMHQEDVDGRAPLHEAVKYDNLDICKWIVEQTKDPILRNYKLLMHEAAIYGDVQMCDWLVGQGLSINETDDDASTMLHIAAKHGNLAVIEWLILNDVDVNAPNTDGNTPYHMLVKHYLSLTEKKHLLERHHTSKEYVVGQDGIERFSSFTSDGDTRLKTLYCFMKAKANVLAKNNDGDTVLSLAFEVDDQDLVNSIVLTDLVKFLVSTWISVKILNIIDFVCNTALMEIAVSWVLVYSYKLIMPIVKCVTFEP